MRCDSLPQLIGAATGGWQHLGVSVTIAKWLCVVKSIMYNLPWQVGNFNDVTLYYRVLQNIYLHCKSFNPVKICSHIHSWMIVCRQLRRATDYAVIDIVFWLNVQSEIIIHYRHRSYTRSVRRQLVVTQVNPTLTKGCGLKPASAICACPLRSRWVTVCR
jgi:hypothetical protein